MRLLAPTQSLCASRCSCHNSVFTIHAPQLHTQPTICPTPIMLTAQQHHAGSQEPGRRSVACQAHPRRVARVASQIQREIGDLFTMDPVIQSAICPERQFGDSALSAIASITHVYVSADLQVVKVYVSVYSDNKGKKRAMDNLKRLEPYVRRHVGSTVRLRLTPEIRFEYDDTLEEQEMVLKVLGQEEIDRVMAENAAEEAARGGKKQATASKEDEDDGFFDEVDEEEFEEYEIDDTPWPDDTPQPLPNPFGDMFMDDNSPRKRKKNTAGRS